jgi:imidazole glycerol-phosphate synthase subunit HisH
MKALRIAVPPAIGLAVLLFPSGVGQLRLPFVGSGVTDAPELVASAQELIRRTESRLSAGAVVRGAEVLVTDDPEAVAGAERIVLPGVGAFADCKRGLEAVPGLEQALREAVVDKGRPFLGICVGMQLMASVGREYEEVEGLGWIPGAVVRLEPRDPSLKIPHMGWNTLRARASHPLLSDIETGEAGWHAYFVHSYHLAAERAGDVLAIADYGGPMTAAVARGNLAGTQFHPEKSQALGLALIANFLKWRP